MERNNDRRFEISSINQQTEFLAEELGLYREFKKNKYYRLSTGQAIKPLFLNDELGYICAVGYGESYTFVSADSQENAVEKLLKELEYKFQISHRVNKAA
jgi:hypothetical protein